MFVLSLAVAAIAFALSGCNAHIGYEKGATDENGVENTANISFTDAYYVQGAGTDGNTLLYVFFDVMADDKENLNLPTDSTSQKLGNVTLETSNGNKYYDDGGKSQDCFKLKGYEDTLGGESLSAGSDKVIHYCSVFDVAPADAKEGVRYEYKLTLLPKAQKMTIPFSAVKSASNYDDIGGRIANFK